MFVSLCVFVLRPSLPLPPLTGGRMPALSSEYKLARLISQIGCPSYRLTSWNKSALRADI